MGPARLAPTHADERVPPPRWRHALVVGGTGGIGHALLEGIAARYPHCNLTATSRSGKPGAAAARWFALDLARPESIAEAVESLTAHGTPAFDHVFVATGWLHGEGARPEKSQSELRADRLAHAMAVNASGPLLLLAGLRRALETTEGAAAARVMVLSAKVGSVSDNRLGGWYAYRMSKAALNMGVRCLGIENARRAGRPIITAVHPGTTHTPLSEPFAKRGLDVVAADVTAGRLLDLAERLGPEHQGGFYHWDGTRLPD